MRIRTIKPEFFTHEGLFELEKETGLPIRVAFSGLWCAADKAGRFKWEPRRIGVGILPYDGVDFSLVLDALFTRGYVLRYRVENIEYGAIPSFSKHQFINNKEKDSDIPAPKAAKEPVQTLTRESRVEDACVTPESGEKEAWNDSQERVSHASFPKVKESKVKEGKDLASSPLFEISGFNETWIGFVHHRKKMKKPLTEFAIELTIKKLESRPSDSIAALQMAVEKGWQSIEWSWFDNTRGVAGAHTPVSAPPGFAKPYDAPRDGL